MVTVIIRSNRVLSLQTITKEMIIMIVLVNLAKFKQRQDSNKMVTTTTLLLLLLTTPLLLLLIIKILIIIKMC